MSNPAENNANSTQSDAPRDWESIRNWLDVVAKLIGAVAIAGVTFIGYNYQSKASLSSVINQREQAESQLRAGMLSDLVEPIIGPKGAAGQEPNLERQLLLAEMVTLNFHDHFEFKPLLLEVDAKLQKAGEEGTTGRDKLASDARRVIDRQINMLSSIGGISKEGKGYRAKVTGIDLVIPKDLDKSNIASPAGCITRDNVRILKPTLARPALICVSSPDDKVCLLLSFFPPEYGAKTITMRSKLVFPREPRSFWPWADRTVDCSPAMNNFDESQDNVRSLDEVYLSIFDFPLTDNSKISWEGDEYRFAVSLYEIRDADRPIRLRLVWFPQGFVTVRERPTSPVQYAKFLR